MINKLISKIRKTNAPIVVGLDPMMKYVPGHITKAAFGEYGETLEGAAEAIWQYNKGIVDAIYDLVPAVKPQIAMYEQFGLPGLEAFRKTVNYCREKDLVVIGDVKRGDIGSTSEAYAVAHLGKVQVGSKFHYAFDEDFATVNPYLGSDGVKPFLKVCREEKKGIFLLVKTSNPSSGELQDLAVSAGERQETIYETVGRYVAEWGAECMPEEGDDVRIYFPSKQEKEAVALSAVSNYETPQTGEEDRMGNPDSRYLRTKAGQELALAPDHIKLSCGKQASSVVIDSDGKVTVQAQTMVRAEAETGMTLYAEESFNIHVQEKFIAQSLDGGQIIMDSGNFYIRGTQVNFD